MFIEHILDPKSILKEAHRLLKPGGYLSIEIPTQFLEPRVIIKNIKEIKSMTKPIRVLHILQAFGVGGVENWLKNIMRYIDHEKIKIDFLVHKETKGYGEDILRSGGRIIYFPYSIYSFKYGYNFKKFLKNYGPYDIIHSHLRSAGFHLFWARQVGIPVRIVHNHIDFELKFQNSNVLKKIGLILSKYLLHHNATSGIAVSRLAAQFGQNWEVDPRWQILYCGIDLRSFRDNFNSPAIRQSLGIPDDFTVIGHVGRFDHQKNHTYLLDIIKASVDINPNIMTILIGDGPLRAEMEKKAVQLGIKEKVLFAGIRHDVASLMLGAMDVFLFPSLYEGLPLVLLEAQAAGLPCIISQTITEEVDIIKTLIARVSLEDRPSIWAQKIIEAKTLKTSIGLIDPVDIIEESPFNIKNSCKSLTNLYQSLLLSLENN